MHVKFSNKANRHLSLISGWAGLSVLVMIDGVNELALWLTRPGAGERLQWGVPYIALRFFVIPLLSALYIGALLAHGLKVERASEAMLARLVGAALLWALCWNV